VSSDENGNFFKTISPNFGYKAAVGFSVPVDATNLYVDYRVGNKVYVKITQSIYRYIIMVVCALGIYVNSYNEGAVGRLTQNDYKKSIERFMYYCKEEALVHAYLLGCIKGQ
jgi:hypothetical protein